MSPSEVGRCSLWQHEAAVMGYIAAHTPEDDKRLSDGDAEDLWAGVMERMQ